ncbi:MAG: FAD-dependent oxidoreductase [bacterium]
MSSNTLSGQTPPAKRIDAAIIGGGIAGAWALNLLQKRGYNCILLESTSLGSDQTLASQGMIHGGLKYALSGVLTGASEAIADMPRRWRACLQGEDEVDLRGARVLSDHYYMFAEATTLGRLTTFFASRALRGRIDKIKPSAWPAEFHGFEGVVYQLNDFVMDTTDLLRTLTAAHRGRVLQLHANRKNIAPHAEGGYTISLADTCVHAAALICCAGNGSRDLQQALGVSQLPVQQRPLKQVIVNHQHDVMMFAHCLTGIASDEPRLTITSHRHSNGVSWYLGGQLADKGVERSDDEQLATARRELATCVPWLDWQHAQFEILTVNRAEPLQASGIKPDEAYVARRKDFIQCFPTKLTLAPDLGDKLINELDPPRYSTPLKTSHPQAEIGVSPW